MVMLDVVGLFVKFYTSSALSYFGIFSICQIVVLQ